MKHPIKCLLYSAALVENHKENISRLLKCVLVEEVPILNSMKTPHKEGLH